MKRCINCGSTTTFTRTRKGKVYEDWFYCETEYICGKCHQKDWRSKNVDKYRESNARHNQISNPRLLRFRDKRILVKENPRKGICLKCGKTGHTNIHHIKYHDDDPLKDTIELCVPCHNKTRN